MGFYQFLSQHSINISFHLKDVLLILMSLYEMIFCDGIVLMIADEHPYALKLVLCVVWSKCNILLDLLKSNKKAHSKTYVLPRLEAWHIVVSRVCSVWPCRLS